MTPEDEAECRSVVFGYATEINEWEIRKFIFDRLQCGKYVSASRAALIAGKSGEDFIQRHMDIFAKYIYPRDRKLGTNPGGSAVTGKEGSFFAVSESTITSVAERNSDTIEVITSWGYLLPGGKTMFVLRKKAGRWLIDSLKTEAFGGGWENCHL